MMRSWSATLGAVLAMGAMGFSACGDDGGGDGSGIGEEDLGTVELQDGVTAVQSVSFSGADAQQVRELRVRNVGTGPLRVDALEVVSQPDGVFAVAQDPSGTPFSADEFPMTVMPSGSGDPDAETLYIYVIYDRPEEADGVSGTLTIVSDSVRGGERERRKDYPISVEGASPRLQVQPREVDFGNVSAANTEVKTVSLLNQGSEELIVDEFVLNGSEAFAIRANAQEWGASVETAQGVTLEEPIVVPPGESRSVTMVFAPEDADPASGNLILFSNDPRQPSGTVVPLQGNVGGPCIAVNPRTVNFGGKLVARTATVDVEVTSCGDQDLRISELFLSDESHPNYDLILTGLPGVSGDPPVTQLGPGDDDVVLTPNQTATFQVTYTPDVISEFDGDGQPLFDLGEIVVRSNAFIAELRVEVVGFGVERECPTPVIVVQEGEEVIPQTNLHLIGSQSFASTGSIQEYQWEVNQPIGAQSVFVPSAAAPDPTFEVNVAGTYVFRLSVTDSAGEESCLPAEVTVLVNPDEALHIELLWETPNDPDETDEGPLAGTDLDLHFAHPTAAGEFDGDGDGLPDPWFDIPWDAFWYNPNPNWANFDEAVDDNPSLDRDDTDGAGPENVNLSMPEDDRTYKVGVHYWNDNGFGESFATLRVYVFSNLVFDLDEVRLIDKDMWDAVRITWSDGSGEVRNVRECEEVNLACTSDADCGTGACGSDFRITPNYVHPFFPAD